MPHYAVTFGFQKGTMGPTETYISPSVSGSNAVAQVQSLINRRNSILFNNVAWAGIRLSLAPSLAPANNNKQRSSFYPPGTYRWLQTGVDLVVPAFGSYVTTTVLRRPDQTRSCIQIRLTYDTDRQTTRYLSFCPDNVILDEPASVNLDLLPDWRDKFFLFRDEIIAKGWSIKARARGAGFEEIPITKWVQALTAPTNVGVAVANLPAPSIGLNDRVSIKGVRRRGTDSLSYNGTYLVYGINTTLEPDSIIFYLNGTEIGDPASIKLRGTIQKKGYTYSPIQQIEAVRGGVHKRGKPLGTPRGRSKTRAKLDP